MKYAQVQASIRENLSRLAELSPTDELRDLAVEVATDLESTEITTCYTKFARRGQQVNRLTQDNAELRRENRRLIARLGAIERVVDDTRRM